MTESEFPKVDGATAMLPMIGEITKSVLNYSDEEAQKYLDDNTHGKTAKVYASLINKEKDLIFVSEPSDDILKSAEDNNVEFEMVGIGLDGFVFLVNKENKVDSLTLEQIQKYIQEKLQIGVVLVEKMQKLLLTKEKLILEVKILWKNGNARIKNEEA